MADPMVVRTVELRDAINVWAQGRNFAETATEKFERKHTVGSYLAQETGMDNRRLLGIMNLETKVTTWAVADRIITAMERPDLMPDAIPNPRWNQERWYKYMEERGCI